MSRLEVGIRLAVLTSNTVQNKHCTKCDLHGSTTNVCIRGDGNVMAPIVIIGEAPGAAEAKHGKPFCGESGQWMRARLEELQLTELTFITNSVRCRPPENRKPTPTEMAACKPYLSREMEIMKPAVIIAAGRVAITQLGLSMQRHTLKVSTTWNCMVMYTWHPAYVKRMGERSPTAREFVADLSVVKDYLYQNILGTVKSGSRS